MLKVRVMSLIVTTLVTASVFADWNYNDLPGTVGTGYSLYLSSIGSVYIQLHSNRPVSWVLAYEVPNTEYSLDATEIVKGVAVVRSGFSQERNKKILLAGSAIPAVDWNRLNITPYSKILDDSIFDKELPKTSIHYSRVTTESTENAMKFVEDFRYNSVLLKMDVSVRGEQTAQTMFLAYGLTSTHGINDTSLKTVDYYFGNFDVRSTNGNLKGFVYVPARRLMSNTVPTTPIRHTVRIWTASKLTG